MARRRSAIAAIAAFGVGVLAACGNGGGDGDQASEGGSVTMWIYPVIPDESTHQTFWNDKVEEFEEENPDIDVQVQIYPWANRDEALTTAIASNTAPDVVYLIPDQLPGYADAIEPIQDYLSEESLNDYFDNVRESVTSAEGDMLGAPILTSANPLFCDKRAFEAIGETEYPSTWDELMALAPRFKDEGIDATVHLGSTEETLNLTYYPLLWQAGGDIFTEDGTGVRFNEAPGLKALTFLKDLVDGGYVEQDLITTEISLEQTNVAAGNVACTWQHPIVELEEVWGAENIVVLPPLADEERIGYGTVGSLTMMNSADNKEAAAAWIEFATSPDVITEYNLESRFLSPKQSTGELYADDPLYGEIEQTVDQMTVGPLHPKAREVMGVLIPEIQAALIGQKDLQQALDDAAQAAEHLLG